MIESHGNDSKTRKLSALWTEIERRKSDFSLSNSWFKDNREKVFLHRIVTGDEKWIFYDNPKKKKYYANPVAIDFNINTTAEHGSKIMLYIWWDQKDLVSMSCWNLAIPLRTIGIDSFVMHYEKNGRSTSKDMIKLFFFTTTLGLMSLKS